jgi:hypothetical protein
MNNNIHLTGVGLNVKEKSRPPVTSGGLETNMTTNLFRRGRGASELAHPLVDYFAVRTAPRTARL